MIIATSQDRATVDCCDCALPTCAAPRKECESVFTSAVTSGLNTQYDEETNTITAYSGKKDLRTTWSVDCSLNCTGYGSITTYVCNTDNGSFEDARTTTFDALFNAGNACWSQSVAATTTCTATGSGTSNTYSIVGSEPTEGNPNPACPTQTYLSVSTTRTRSIVPPNTETEDYLAWKAIYPTQQDYDDAVAAYQQYLADYDQWVLDWDAWDAGGQVGPEPQQPEEVFEPEPPPDPQYYPPCTTVDEWATTEYPHPCNGGENTVTTGKEYNTDLANYSSFPGCAPTLAYPDDEWTGPVDQETLLSQMDTTLRAHMGFEEECLGTDCVSRKVVTLPSNAVRSLYVSLTNVRYRFGVPVDYSTVEAPRSTWEMQWDEVSASDDWWAWFDGGMTGTEPTPGPSLVTARSWIWGGSMESPWSSWFEMDPPTEPDSQVRVVNVLIKCWKSTRIGVAPTAYGDQVELPA